ncbi:MAG: helix-turn-helix transcriptional regulator [Clostridia bacterium]|nr:helix-turn-helix transcriptional regulator [Clostridia bacterium]
MNGIENADFSQTGYSYTLSLIAGKYKPIILYCLMEYEPVRFNEMRRYLGKIADKTLSLTLKELERDGLVHRNMYPEIPPKVEYTLTERGRSLMQVLDQLCTWGMQNQPKDASEEEY